MREPRFQRNIGFIPILLCSIVGLLGIAFVALLIWTHVNGESINTLLD
jgi:hypothetical protein